MTDNKKDKQIKLENETNWKSNNISSFNAKFKFEFIKELLSEIPENIREKYDLKDIIINNSGIRIQKGNIDSVYFACSTSTAEYTYTFKFKFKDFHYAKPKFVFSDIYIQRDQKLPTAEFRYDKNLNLNAIYLVRLPYFNSELPVIEGVSELHMLNVYNKFLEVHEQLEENEGLQAVQIMKNNEECINFYALGAYKKPLMWSRTEDKIKEITDNYSASKNDMIKQVIKITYNENQIIKEDVAYLFMN